MAEDMQKRGYSDNRDSKFKDNNRKLEAIVPI